MPRTAAESFSAHRAILEPKIVVLLASLRRNFGAEPEYMNFGHVGSLVYVEREIDEILRFLNLEAPQ